jgi:outer membrane receptor protein involved in Fe transport
MFKCYSAVIAVACCLFASHLFAGTTGKIAGRITDAKTNEGLPSVTISVQGTSLGAATDPDGKYVILNVPPGTYSLNVSYVGYQNTKAVNVGVSVDYTTTLNFQLKESSVELNEVIVQGERNPLVRQDQTNPVAAVTSDQLAQLPVTSVSDVIGLQAGVVVSDDGGIHIRGGRDNEIAYTLNGMSVNNPYNNVSSVGVATNALQEVSVSSGTFSAEYGNSLSGVVNYVTKEGGQNYTGSARAFSGDYVSNRDNVFPNIRKIDAANTARGEATLGGPVPLLGDKVTFYASGVYERDRGFLYGQRIYTPNDFYVTRDQLTWQKTLLDSVGQPAKDASGNILYVTDPRKGSQSSPYYFNPIANDTSVKNSLPTGDNSTVPMNSSESYNVQANIAYKFSSTMRLKYEIVANAGTNASSPSSGPDATSSGADSYYYNEFRFDPDGRPQDHNRGIIHSLDWQQTLSPTVFYTLKASYNYNQGRTMAYDSWNDPRYLPGFYQTTLPTTSFYTGGVSLGRTTRSTETISGKFDLVAQLFGVHEVKFGIEARKHKIDYESYTLQFVDQNNPSYVITKFQDIYVDGRVPVAHIPDAVSGYVHYVKEPIQGSSYIQDKIELAKSLILNVGFRYEFFDPAAKYNPNLDAALSSRDTVFLVKDLKDATVKQSLSPRISIAYPITDQGVIRFSYGHFYQFGNLQSLYSNSSFRALEGSTPSFGNADVKPQRSVQYEIGLTQGFTPDLRAEVVGFYKDVRDYIYSQLVVTAKGDQSFNVLTNLSYANSRGVTISLLQRQAPGSIFSASLDYTFSVSEGNRTEPAADFFFSDKSGKSTETFLVPLDFDRAHTLNATVNLSEADNFTVSTICRLRTGSPYTPSIPASLSLQQTQFVQNSSTKPFQWSIDLKAEKYFKLNNLNCSVFLLVDNLFDVQNETDVWTNSGRALYSADQVANPHQFDQITTRILRGDAGLIPISAIDNYFVNPNNVSRPRLVRLGVSLYF